MSEPGPRPAVAPGGTRDFTLAVDIGGTFTDLIGYDARARRFLHAKSLSTPRDLVDGILACVQRSGADLSDATQVVHGTTVAINTVLETKGARTGLIVTRGTRDVYSIGRGNRPDAYNLLFRRPRPFVPRSLTFEVPERVLATGEVRDAARRGPGYCGLRQAARGMGSKRSPCVSSIPTSIPSTNGAPAT